MTPERDTVVTIEYESKMRDVGRFKGKFKLLRKTASIVSNIKATKAALLGGSFPVSQADALHFDVMATLTIAVFPVPNPTPLNQGGWIDEILDPAIWYAIYDRWQAYQASFSEASDADGKASAI